VLEAPRAGGPVRVDSAETLLPLTRGVVGNRERGAFCLDYFSFFFSPLNKHVETCVLTCIDIRLI